MFFAKKFPMPRKNNGDVPRGARAKALAYLRGTLPRGYHGAAEKTIRDALGTNGSVVKFRQDTGMVEVYKTPEGVPDIYDFEMAEILLENYFERMRARA